jgi:hypothetical protein
VDAVLSGLHVVTSCTSNYGALHATLLASCRALMGAGWNESVRLHSHVYDLPLVADKAGGEAGARPGQGYGFRSPGYYEAIRHKVGHYVDTLQVCELTMMMMRRMMMTMTMTMNAGLV